MTLHKFRGSLTATEPPPGLALALAGPWSDARGDWTRAHESAQQNEGVVSSWVHAYMHRKEGGRSNAAYWYSFRSVANGFDFIDAVGGSERTSCGIVTNECDHTVGVLHVGARRRL